VSRTPNLSEAIRLILEHRLSGLHVCLPARVESYDAATQTCSAVPAVKNLIAVEDGDDFEDFEEAYPIISDVPVASPRWGAWHLVAPLAPGDHVTLIFGERALDRWRQLGGIQGPGDLRKHDLSDAIAWPVNVYPDAAALTALPPHLVLGKLGGSTIHVKEDGTVALGSENPTDAAATANKVAAELGALKAALDLWVPVPNDGGAALKLALSALFLTGWPASTASSKVKVDP
jgi:hypothetical protein